jgi:UDP-2,3-diacylglucosamine pyrophosphatase LpxH
MNPEGQLLPPYRLIHESLGKGLVIPFLGAGASFNRASPSDPEGKKPRELYLPTAYELADYLARKAEFPSGETLDLAKVAQYYSLVGGRTPLYRELHSIFDRDFPVAALHTFLASIPHPLLIITTNYDDLIERAFLQQGRSFDIVVHTTNPDLGDRVLWLQHGSTVPREVSPNKLDIDLGAVTVIYKMHGTVDRRKADLDQYVITEDDYVDFLVRMTKNKAIPAIFAEPFQNSHFLFLGYSLRDWNLRVILNRIQTDLRRASDIISWGIQYKPSLMERKFWQKRGVEVYDLLLDEFVKALAERARGDSAP